MVERSSKKGVFYSCSRYPDCKAALNSKPVGRPCPTCSAPLIEKIAKGEVVGVRCSNRACKYVEEEGSGEEPVALAA